MHDAEDLREVAELQRAISMSGLSPGGRWQRAATLARISQPAGAASNNPSSSNVTRASQPPGPKLPRIMQAVSRPASSAIVVSPPSGPRSEEPSKAGVASSKLLRVPKPSRRASEDQSESLDESRSGSFSRLSQSLQDTVSVLSGSLLAVDTKMADISVDSGVSYSSDEESEQRSVRSSVSSIVRPST